VLALAALTFSEREQDLNRADSRLGDGDTGMTLRRLTQRMVEGVEAIPDEPPNDVGEFFQKAGMAGAGATGSSLGTLIALAFIGLAKFTAGRTDLDHADLADLLTHARDLMKARGHAELGDKTVLDAIDAIATALTGTADAQQQKAAAAEAARKALDSFRGRPNRIGRARMFGDRTIGSDDPGMLALTYLTDAIAAQ
jgi:dihydroxyacetone kinase